MTAILALGLSLALVATATADEPAPGLVLLGEATLERGIEIDGAPLGGLSALVRDPLRGIYYALSDDPSRRDAARFYTLDIGWRDGRLPPDGVRVVWVTRLTDRRNRPFPPGFFDGEGLALTRRRTLLASSEGNVEQGVPPSLWEFDLDGRALRRLRLPRRYRPRPGRRGVRHNLALEGLTVAPGGGHAFVGTENALVQDGPASSLDAPTLCRIARIDLPSGRFVAEYLYPADPIAAAPIPAGGFAVNGLVELLALDSDRALALERSYSAGVGNGVRLYEARLGPPPSHRRRGGWRWWRWWRRAPALQRAEKRLLLDLGTLAEVKLDNLEGLTFGPALADGRCTLLTISDDNFSTRQRTQILAFALAADLGGPGCSAASSAAGSALQNRVKPAASNRAAVVKSLPQGGLSRWE